MSEKPTGLNIVFVQGSSLSIKRAHWVQILNTAYALSRRENIDVWILARTIQPGAMDEVYGGMGFAPNERFHVHPVVPARVYNAFGLHGDLLSQSQGKVGRWLALRHVKRLLREISTNGKPIVFYTRDQDVPTTSRELIARYQALAINEHHKFEYVKTLEGKLKKKRPGRSTLAQFKNYARGERDRELQRLATFDGVVCTTQNIRERLIDHGYGKPTICIPNGANLDTADSLESILSKREKNIDILYVGQLLRWKNVDLLIEAMPRLPGRRLTVVGGEPGEDMDRLKGLAARLDVADRVDFWGHRPHGEIKGIMQRSCVGVVPLPRAGFPEARLFCCPLKALEMMAAGTPIVATRLRSVEGLLEHRRNALLVEPDDAQAMADGIRDVLENDDLRRQLAEGGWRTARDLSYDERGRKILAFIEECRTGK